MLCPPGVKRPQGRPGLRPTEHLKTAFITKPQTFFPPARFRFLNQWGQVTTPGDWACPNHSALWGYNLHYFDDLNADGAPERIDFHRQLMTRWIDENPPAKGIGWDAYPMSLRIVNWIKWHLSGNDLSPKQKESLYLQTGCLENRLEYHLLGNHLIANAKALIFAGLFFNGNTADKWIAKGFEILIGQVDEQINTDGGHFERSPMYHAIILEDLLDVIHVSSLFPASIYPAVINPLKDSASGMVTALKAMCHPDGDIAFFNDAASGIASSLTELSDYARVNDIHLQQNVPPLTETGIIRSEKNNGVLLVEAGSVGPGYLPGHAHAGTLSFEFSIGTRRIIVNSGTSCYGTGQERHRQRGSAAHNTLMVDGMNSSEVWSGFRVARRARVRARECRFTETHDVIEASHDGFKRIKHLGLHHRKWEFSVDSLAIQDSMEGNGKYHLTLSFHFHPSVRLEEENNRFQITDTSGVVLATFLPDRHLKFNIRETTYHPQFGLSIPTKVLRATTKTRLPLTVTNRLIEILQ